MNKNIIFALTFLTSFSLFAKEASIGRIANIVGAGFISQEGKTEEIRKGTLVYPNSEIVVEHSGMVTYADNFDHQFHLGNSSSFQVNAKSVVLRSGDMWFQSMNKSENFTVTTANGAVEFQSGEGVVTYDTGKGKTQLMVINGLMKLSNLRVRDLNISVSEGNFSYVDNAYDEGAPRDPTPVGEKTYKNLVSEFTGVKPMDKNSEKIFKSNDAHESHSEKEVKREVASVHADSIKAEKTESHVAVKVDSTLEEYKNSMLEKKSKHSLKKVEKKEYAKVSHHGKVVIDKEASPLVVQIYGQKSKIAESNRLPASMSTPEMAVVEKTTSPKAMTEIKTESKIENKPVLPSKETEKLLDSLNKL